MKQLVLFPFDPDPVVLPHLDNSAYVHFTSIDPEENRFRFYTITWQKTLWGEWTIRTTWGRIGGAGRSQVSYFESWEELRAILLDVVAYRLARGYRIRRPAIVRAMWAVSGISVGHGQGAETPRHTSRTPHHLGGATLSVSRPVSLVHDTVV